MTPHDSERIKELVPCGWPSGDCQLGDRFEQLEKECAELRAEVERLNIIGKKIYESDKGKLYADLASAREEVERLQGMTLADQAMINTLLAFVPDEQAKTIRDRVEKTATHWEKVEAENASLSEGLGKVVEALKRYMAKFGNCGDVYDQAKEAIGKVDKND